MRGPFLTYHGWRTIAESTAYVYLTFNNIINSRDVDTSRHDATCWAQEEEEIRSFSVMDVTPDVIVNRPMLSLCQYLLGKYLQITDTAALESSGEEMKLCWCFSEGRERSGGGEERFWKGLHIGILPDF